MLVVVCLWCFDVVGLLLLVLLFVVCVVVIFMMLICFCVLRCFFGSLFVDAFGFDVFSHVF